MIIKHPLNGSRDDFGWRYLDTSNNLTMPWYTIGCLQWINSLDLSNMSVFEYGCGISSIWWKSKVEKWDGVDSEEKWANGGLVPLKQNGEIDKQRYISACLKDKYNLIIIDGVFRDDCTEFALKSIKEDGFIIIDNWDQETCDTGGNFWDKTKSILKDYKCVIHKEPDHVDWKTVVFEIKRNK